MSTRTINTIIILFIAFVISNCTKDNFIQVNSPKSKNLKVDTAYDRHAQELMIAVHQSLNNQLFCKTLTEEILKKPDGDYEVILKSFVKKLPDFNKTPLFASLGGNRLKSLTNPLDVLEKYPKLQLAIPVCAEKWDGKSKIHVAYLPSDYNEGITKEIPAIAPDGSKVMLDAVKEPDFPVIVIGLNERSNKNGIILTAYNREKVPFNRNHLKYGEEGITNFTAEASTNSMAVFLRWNYTQPEYLYPYDYFFAIYRDDLTGNGFQKIAEVPNYSTYFNDINVNFGKTYSYYIIAMVDLSMTYDHSYYEQYYYSSPAEATTATPPDFCENFSVECTSPTVMDLNWKIKTLSNWTNLEIWKQTTYNTAWQLVTSLPTTSIFYQDVLNNPYPACNVKYTYRLQVSNRFSGAMQAFKCSEYLANRYDNQKTIINSLAFPSYSVMRDKYEGWPRGNPEWRIEVAAPRGGTTFQVANFEWEGIKSCCETLSGKIINSWPKSELGNVLTFYMTEIDGDPGEITLSLGIAPKVKLFDSIDVNITTGISYKFKLGDGDDVVGKALYFYWNNANSYNFLIGDCTLNLSQYLEW